MRTLWAGALGATLLLSSYTASAGELLPAKSRVWLDGKSTVRPFTCAAQTSIVAVDTSAESGALTLATVESGAATGKVRVLVRQLDCQDAVMNDHMREALHAKEHSEIVFELQSYTASAGTGSEVPLTLQGMLTIAGRTQPVRIAAVARQLPDGGLVVQGRHALRMTSYGVVPPSLFFGAMRVEDAVTVGFELNFPARHAQAQGMRGHSSGRRACASAPRNSL